MGWGDSFYAAWNGATAAAKKTATSVAQGVNSATEWTAQKATAAKDWAAEKTTQAKDYAVEKAVQAKNKAIEAKDYAVEKATQAKDYAVEKATQAKDYAVEKATQAKDYAVEKATQAKDYAVEKATQAKDYAVEKATQAKDYAVEKATQAKDYAVEKAVQAKDAAVAAGTEVVRQGAKSLAGGALGAMGVANVGYHYAKKGVQSIAEGAKSAFNTVRGWFGLAPVGQPCPTCPGPQPPTTDQAADGYFMGDECTPFKTAAEAKAKPVTPDSTNHCCSADKRGKKTIYYVNGVQTTRKAHCDTLHAIANSTCANVVGIYNATANPVPIDTKNMSGAGKLWAKAKNLAGSAYGFVADGLQTGGDRLLGQLADAGVVLDADGRNKAVDTVSDAIYQDAKAKIENKDAPEVEIWAHSQGGAVTSQGLFSANNRLAAAGYPNGLAGVKVKSMGSAAPEWVDGPTYEHYVHSNDLTPLTLGLGDQKSGDPAKAGRAADGTPAKVVRFSGDHTTGVFPDAGQPGYGHTAPSLSGNHGVENVYVTKQDQVNGGCGIGSPAAAH